MPASVSICLQDARAPVSLIFAIPDHPWVDTAEGAAVRIAMTVAEGGEHSGELARVIDEKAQADGSSVVGFAKQVGRIAADMTLGAGIAATKLLEANSDLVSRGVQTIGEGFVVTREQAEKWTGRNASCSTILRPFLNGKDVTASSRDAYVIDFFGLSKDEAMKLTPEPYQHLLVLVKPERDQSRRDTYRERWWILGEPQPALRRMTAALERYIVTPVTAKHRFFLFVDKSVLADQALNVFAFNDAFYLGVLSSRIHVTFALAAGATLEDRPRYNNTRCFDPFPFPACDEAAKARIRSLAEELDAHRKRVQAQHPDLTLTGMYNVLEALRAGRQLTPKEQVIHEQGLVSVLLQLHEDLDAAVAAAYGWPVDLPDAEILTRLVALNAERAAEEAAGTIRWLRPEYQRQKVEDSKQKPEQTNLQLPAQLATRNPQPSSSPRKKLPWPKTLADRVRLVDEALRQSPTPQTAESLAKHFTRAKVDDITEILETLTTLGRAHRDGEKFTA